MSNVSSFITHSHVNASAKLEKLGDVLLTPTRNVFEGKKFVLLENGAENLRFELPYSTSKWVKIALKILSLPGLILFPLGLLIKSLSLLNKETRNTYSNLTTPESLSRKEIHQKCEEKGLRKELFFEVITNQKAYLEFNLNESTYVYSPLGFAECACEQSGAFDRFRSHRRTQLENQIVQDLPQDKSQTIHLLSMGSGDLLQDWILLGRVLKEGYSSVEIDLVDPRQNDKRYQRFTDFFSKFDNVTISKHTSIKDVDKSKRFDAVNAIDYDDYLDGDGPPVDLFTTKGYLKENGKIYLGATNEDLTIHAGCKIQSVGSPKTFVWISENIHESKNQVSIISSLAIITIPLLLPTISKLIKEGVKTIDLTLVEEGPRNPFKQSPEAIRQVFDAICPDDVTLNIEAKQAVDENRKYDYIVTAEFEDFAKTADSFRHTNSTTILCKRASLRIFRKFFSKEYAYN